jgi:hypothetical protein
MKFQYFVAEREGLEPVASAFGGDFNEIAVRPK